MGERKDLGAEFNQNSDLIIRSSILFRKRANTFPSVFSASDSFCESFPFDVEETFETGIHETDNADKTATESHLSSLFKSLDFSSKANSSLTPMKTSSGESPVSGSQWNSSYSPIQNNSLMSLPSPISSLMSAISPISSLNIYNPPHLPIRYMNYSPVYTSPVYNSPYGYPQPNYNYSDRVADMAKRHRNAAHHAEARHTWSGILISSMSNKTPVFSCKVFLGGVPWEMTDHDIKLTFSRFGNPNILRPGQHVKLSRSSQSKEKAGYLYLIFESDKQVKSLINACTHDFSNGGKYYFALNQSRYRPKDVQIIPWNVNDTSYVKSPSARMDTNKTVFVGALHGMLTAEGLAQILEDLFGGVVYVGIDTDKYKYPIGSGRVTFSTVKSYNKAVQAAFIDVKCNKFTKKIQIDPFLEDSNCANCRTEKGPVFCRSACMAYYCRGCWDHLHSTEGMQSHQPIMRNKARY